MARAVAVTLLLARKMILSFYYVRQRDIIKRLNYYLSWYELEQKSRHVQIKLFVLHGWWTVDTLHLAPCSSQFWFLSFWTDYWALLGWICLGYVWSKCEKWQVWDLNSPSILTLTTETSAGKNYPLPSHFHTGPMPPSSVLRSRSVSHSGTYWYPIRI